MTRHITLTYKHMEYAYGKYFEEEHYVKFEELAFLYVYVY